MAKEALTENEFNLFKRFIQRQVGVTLHPTRLLTLSRKINKRMDVLGIPTFAAYYRFIKTEKGKNELTTLINIVTIDQTSFFRGDKQFDLFVEELLPTIVKNRAKQRRLRIWSAGCSRGHEPYSVAMLLLEKAHGTYGWDNKILATDIDSECLRSTKNGCYGPEIAEQVSETYIRKYFVRKKQTRQDLFCAKQRLKNLLVIRRLNLLSFPYPLTGPLDLIFCRNVMIYFETRDKKRILQQFHRLLAPDGFLLLGGSESLLGIDEDFSLVGHAVYKRGQ